MNAPEVTTVTSTCWLNLPNGLLEIIRLAPAPVYLKNSRPDDALLDLS